jgi:hypothetical protein
MSNTIQLGSFLFSEVEGKPDKVFIQIANDGEGGFFNFADLPHYTRFLLPLPNARRFPDAWELNKVETEMWEFWKKYFKQ